MMVVHNDTFDSEDRQHSEILEIVSPILTSVLINNDLAYVMKLAMIGSRKRKVLILHIVQKIALHSTSKIISCKLGIHLKFCAFYILIRLFQCLLL